MELRIIGTSAAFPGKNDACASYLLAWKGRRYLIDAGPGSLAAIQEFTGYADLSGIFLSHLHADHISDFYTLRYAVQAAQREGRMARPLPLYMPLKPGYLHRFIRRTCLRSSPGSFRVVALDERLTLDLDGLEASFLRTEHPVETYAMKFRRPGNASPPAGGDFVYTSDTAYFPALVQFCRGAGLLLAEATLQDKDQEMEGMGHMSAARAGALAGGAGARRLVLTHIWPEYDRSLSLQQAGRTFTGEIRLAERGALYTL
jgi:ribonuclease BN (tRNA processing enzyme)